MKKSTVWLVVGMGALMMVGVLACCGFFSLPSTSGPVTTSGSTSAAAADVDLEALTQAFKRHVEAGHKDLNAFEREVNKPEIYKGTGTVRVTLDDKGQVLGYVDEDSQPGFDATRDRQVFALNVDPQEKRIVASDRYHRHYGLGMGDVLGIYFLSRMISGQRGYYPAGRWSAPRSGRWVTPGYYGRVRGSSPSSRSGSRRGTGWGAPSRRSSSGGGFGFGK